MQMGFKQRNDDGVATGATICALILTSLFISSFLISYFALSMYGVELTGDSVIILPNSLSSYSPNQIQDFTKSDNISAVDVVGGWSYNPGIGWILTSPLTLSYNRIFEIDIKPTSNKLITNTYKVNNSVKGNWDIILRNSNGIGTTSNILRIRQDGFHVPNTFDMFDISTWGTDAAFVPYPNANQVEDVEITTIYNDELYTLSFIFNGQTFNMQGLKPNTGVHTVMNTVYGGVISNVEGFTLEGFSSDNIVGTSNYIPVLGSDNFDIGSLITTMLKLLTYGLPTTIMPIEIQILLIRTQEAILVIGIAAFLRGI